MADRVQQMRLALPRRGLEIERRELRRFRRGHALRGIIGQHIAFARHEAGKGERGVEACAAKLGDGIGGAGGRGRMIVRGSGTDMQLGQLAAAGMDRDADIAHFAASDLPGKREPVREPVVHPVGREFGGKIKVERPRLAAEIAQLDRADPLAVQLLAQVLAQAYANVRPVCRQGLALFFCHQIIHFAVHWPACRPSLPQADPAFRIMLRGFAARQRTCPRSSHHHLFRSRPVKTQVVPLERPACIVAPKRLQTRIRSLENRPRAPCPCKRHSSTILCRPLTAGRCICVVHWCRS